MGWGPVPRRAPSGRITGYRVVNTVTRRQVNGGGNFTSKAAALAAIAAINAGYKQKPETTRARLEAATQAAATRRRRHPRRKR